MYYDPTTDDEEVVSPIVNRPTLVIPAAPIKFRRPFGVTYLLPWEEQPAEYLAARSAEMRRPLMDRAHVHVILHGDHATAHLHRGSVVTESSDVMLCFSGKMDPWICQCLVSEFKNNRMPWQASSTLYLITRKSCMTWSVHPNFQFS